MYTVGFFQRKGKNVFKKLKLFLNFQQYRHGIDRDMYAAYWQGIKVAKGTGIRHFEII